MKLYQTVRTPCIGVCSTGIGDSVCRGCKRFDHEVIQWNGFTQAQKAAIDKRLSNLLAGVVATRFYLQSVEILSEQLKVQQIRFAEYRDPYCWLFELLRAGAGQINDTELYGFVRMKKYTDRGLAELRDDIDSEFYALSIAHFERYIVANQRKANTVSTPA